MITEVFEKDDLKVCLTETTNAVTLSWLGQSNARDPNLFLSPLLSSLMQRLLGKKVTLDFRKFDYMNSATVAPLLAFIKGLDANGIATTLLYTTSLSWQRVSFQSMKVIARTLKNLQVHGE